MRHAAARLAEKGRRVGLITNDQAADLVDTALVSQDGLEVREVSGSCFCCNFRGLVEAAEELRRKAQAEIILAEPVGSCTDLAATLIQPLKSLFEEDYSLSPLSVVADPMRLLDVYENRLMKPNVRYLYRVQLEEADIILLNKIDLLKGDDLALIQGKTAASFVQAQVMPLSALEGTGVDLWLSSVLEERGTGRVVAVDYERYGKGEAELAWLNAKVRWYASATSTSNAVWQTLGSCLMDQLHQKLHEQKIEIGHVKCLIRNSRGYLRYSIIRLGGQISKEGSLSGETGEKVSMIFNARVEAAPVELEKQFFETLNCLTREGYLYEIRDYSCLSPAQPHPTYRMGGGDEYQVR